LCAAASLPSPYPAALRHVAVNQSLLSTRIEITSRQSEDSSIVLEVEGLLRREANIFCVCAAAERFFFFFFVSSCEIEGQKEGWLEEASNKLGGCKTGTGPDRKQT
jgi:hypothetical protein